MKFWYSCFPLIICVISINFQCNGDEIKTPFDLHVQQGTKVSLDESITGSLFGFSLALKDMTLFVGAPKYDEGKGGAFYCDLKDCKKYVECSCEAINSINERGNGSFVALLSRVFIYQDHRLKCVRINILILRHLWIHAWGNPRS